MYILNYLYNILKLPICIRVLHESNHTGALKSKNHPSLNKSFFFDLSSLCTLIFNDRNTQFIHVEINVFEYVLEYVKIPSHAAFRLS